MISIIHPSRGRAWKSKQRMLQWINNSESEFEIVVSLDLDDPELPLYLHYYEGWGHLGYTVMSSKNRSCVDAINNAAKEAKGDILLVVSDDTDCFPHWDTALLKEVEGKSDYLLKTKDGIQDYIVTMTVMDRKYYERDGFIYHPDFRHQFADTYLTCLADIRGCLIYSDLVFPHKHYSTSGEQPDALHKRNDATWKEGQDTFIRLMKQFSKADIQKIQDRQMIRFLRNNGVQV
jgi:hypothetical protein